MILEGRISLKEFLNGRDFCHFIRVRVAHSDSAHIDSSLNLEEPFISPVCSPRVAHEPVIKPRLLICAVAYDRNSMVYIYATVSWVEDPSSVVLENQTSSIDWDCNWLLCNCSFDRRGSLRSNTLVSFESHSALFSLSLIISALALVVSSVWPVLFEICKVLHQVGHSVVSLAANATISQFHALNKLLLW